MTVGAPRATGVATSDMITTCIDDTSCIPFFVIIMRIFCKIAHSQFVYVTIYEIIKLNLLEIE